MTSAEPTLWALTRRSAKEAIRLYFDPARRLVLRVRGWRLHVVLALVAEETTKKRGGGAAAEEPFVLWWHATPSIHNVSKHLSATRTQSRRRVSMILRHPAWEFTDFLPLSFCPVEVVC